MGLEIGVATGPDGGMCVLRDWGAIVRGVYVCILMGC